MKIEDIKKRKIELGYTNEMIAEKSGVPLGTVQKFFGGATSKPRFNTIQSIECVLFPELHGRKEAAIYKEMAENLALEDADHAAETSAFDEYNADVTAADHRLNYERVLSWKEPGEYTVEDWFGLPEGVRMELIDGTLYDMASPTREHQFIAGQLFAQLNAVTTEKGTECLPFIAPLGVQLFKDEKNMFEPDVMLVCDSQKYREGKVIFGAPDFAAEVLSPSTAWKDINIKLGRYWKAGVREYWIIDIKEKEVWTYRFGESTVLNRYGFEEQIPLAISGGDIVIDFKSISDRMKRYFGE